MRRSKFEMYIDILQIMAFQGPKRITHLMYKANVNMMVLRESLRLLLEKGLIEERNMENGHTAYAITKKGYAALASFKELSQALPEVESDATLKLLAK